MVRILPAFAVLLVALRLSAAQLPDGAVLRFGEPKWQGFSVERAVAISPDGKRIATGGANPPVQVWDAATGKLLYDHGATGSVLDLRWTPAGKLVGLTFFGHDGFFMAGWDGEKDKGITSEQYQKLHQAAEKVPKRGGRISRTVLSEDGRRVAALRELEKDERVVEIHDFKPNTPSVLDELRLVLSLPLCDGVWLSRDGNTLIAYQRQRPRVDLLTAFDLTAKKPDEGVWRLTLGGVNRWPSEVLTADGKRLAVRYSNDQVELWDGPKGEKLRTWNEPMFVLPGRGEPAALALSPDGNRLAVSVRQESGLVGGAVFDFDTNKELAKLAARPMPHALALRFAPDGKKLVRASYGAVRLWDAATGTDASPTTGHVGPVRSVAVASDGKTVVTAGADLTVRGWSPATGKEMWRLDYPLEVTLRRVSPDLAFLTGSQSTAVPKPLLNLSAGQARALPAAMAGKQLVAVSPDGKTAVSLDTQKPSFEFWDWPIGKHRDSFAIEPPGKELAFTGEQGIHFTPDGKQLVALVQYSTAENGRKFRRLPVYRPFLERWDIATGKRLEQVEQGRRSASALVTNGKRLLLVTADGTVTDGVSGAGVGKLDPDGQPRFEFRYRASVALSPDGKTLAVADGWASDGDIRLFDLTTGKAATRKAGGRSGNLLAYLPDDRLLSAGESVFVWAK